MSAASATVVSSATGASGTSFPSSQLRGDGLGGATTVGSLTLAELLEEVGQRVRSEMQAQAVAPRQEEALVTPARVSYQIISVGVSGQLTSSGVLD